jgi:membrane fusion protein, multidrug efflux system
LMDTKRNTVLIPTAAIQHGPQATFVFVVKPDNTVEMRNIAQGPVEKGTASVDQGLNTGEVVVTEGVDKLQQGIKVNVSPNQAAAKP